jgi:hypothetical protein
MRAETAFLGSGHLLRNSVVQVDSAWTKPSNRGPVTAIVNPQGLSVCCNLKLVK